MVASTNSVELGDVQIGNGASATISLVNKSAIPVAVIQLNVVGQFFSVAGHDSFPVSVPAGGTYGLTVDFNPTSAGPATGQLTISSNASTSATVINLSGTGAAAAQSAPQLTGISCISASMTGAGTDRCTVTISGPAPAGGFRVGLSSNNAAVPVPTASLVAANATAAQFTPNVSAVSTAQTAILTASAGSVTESFALQLNVSVPTLSIAPSSVAFGSVAVNTPATQIVTISSTGTGPVTISGATVTGAGFALAPSTFPISLNPGQTLTLSAQFDPASEGAATGQLTVTSNSSINSKAVIALSGTGAPRLTGISCGSASMGGTGSDLCTVTISGPAPAGGFRVGLSSNNAAVIVPSASLVAANATTAQFPANVSPVSAVQTVILTASAGAISESFALQLNVPVPTLSIFPSSVTFGSVAVNTPATQTVTISSTGTGPVTISGATVTGAGFTLAPSTFPVSLNPGQTLTLGVQFDPSTQDASAGQLTVTSNSSINSTAVIALSGTGAPRLTGISCSSASMTGAGTDSCTVTISGPAPAGGFRVGLTSNNAAVPVPSASLIAANATTGHFTPNVSPVSTTQTVILTASAGAISESFALQLNAALPNLSVGAASVAFGNVAFNVAVTRTVTLKSTGAATLTISGATVTGLGFTLAPSTFPISLNPGQAFSLGVQFDTASAEAASGRLTITSNSSVNSSTVISLSGTGAASGTFSYAGSPIESTLVPPNPSTPISSNFFGMTITHLGSTPFPAFPVSTFRFWDVAPWSAVEPSSGQFVWTKMDTTISMTKANGVSDYIYTLGSVPVWASTNPTDPCTNGDGAGACDPPDMTAFDDFTKQVVQRYCGTIKYYETWNEPNNPSYWNGTNSQLLTIAQHIYQTAKDPANCGCTNGVCAPNGGVNPNQVLMPPISHISTLGLNWLDAYLGSAGAQYPYADVAAFHGYGATNPEDIATQIQLLNQTLANHGLSNIQLWNTEASWGSLTEVDRQQASWLMRYHVLQAAAGVSRFVWYAYDNCGWGTLWESPYCINPQMPVGQLTAPGQAYGVIESWLSGATLQNCQLYENGLWVCELQRPGNYSAWMLWSSTGTEISVPIPDSSGLTVYRDWQNNVNPLASELTVDEMPVLLGNLAL